MADFAAQPPPDDGKVLGAAAGVEVGLDPQGEPLVASVAPLVEPPVVPPLVASAAPLAELPVESVVPLVASAAPLEGLSVVPLVASEAPLVASAAPEELSSPPDELAFPDSGELAAGVFAAPAAEDVPLEPPLEAHVVALPGVVVKADTVKSGLPPFFHVQHGSPKAAPLVMLDPGNFAAHKLLYHVWPAAANA